MTEDQLTACINNLAKLDSQQAEVAGKFYCEARSLLRAGKPELAARKVRAADAIITGKVVDL